MISTEINWAYAQNAKYFLLLIPVLIILIYKWRRSQLVIRLLSHASFKNKFLQKASLIRITIRSILWFIALVFLFITLLRPQWNKKEQIVAQEARDLFIALDISRSMLAQDIKPNRLEFAKQKIKDLVNELSSERVGLILFSGSSFIQCPLTSDYAAFFMFLDQIDVETISSGSTAIDQAIAQALEAFKSAGNKKNKLLIIVTDGEDFSSNLVQLKNEAHRENLIIFTLGIGTQQGAPIPLFDENGKQVGHQKDRKGAVVISRLNDVILKNLVHDVGGIYIHAQKGDSDIIELIKKLETIEKEKIEDKKYSQYEDQYPIFLMISFIALLLEWLL
jgi:Ca-activated chloride channel family protein